MVGVFRKLKESLSSKFSHSKSDSPSHPPRRSASISESGHSQPPPRYFTSNGYGRSSSSLSQLPRSRSSSSFSRLSRAFSVRASKKTCTICLGDLKIGEGRAIFVAECSHSFHFNCITSNVKHGNQICPICRCKWKEIPFQATSSVLGYHRNGRGQARVPINLAPAFIQSFADREPHHFYDDEPLPQTAPDYTSSAPLFVAVKSFTEYPAVLASESCSEFAVLASIRAPPLSQRDRAPVDLVTVLDISGSMAGSKLSLLKNAVHFVIQNLGPSDRLSIVVFSSTAHRIFPLRRMTESARGDAILAINSLSTYGGTNIAEGLKKGIRVLDERQVRNPVYSIILLSDGRAALPSSIHSGNNNSTDSASQQATPVHSFGFGTDHDSATLHAISDASGGTFSFIESVGMVQDAFARCIGGLLSVVARDLQLKFMAAAPAVQISSIRSGRYISEICDEGKQGIIDVGNLYAEEEKGFLLYISIPATSAEGNGNEKTTLLDITCKYKDSASEELVQVEGGRVEIQRLDALSPTEVMVSLEVDRHRNRVLVADGIAEAQRLAERGDLQGAKALLAARRSILLSSASAEAGDALCNLLEAELRETSQRMQSMEQYEHTGRAYILSGLSSHSWQRATTRGDSLTQTFVINEEGRDPNASGAFGYDTPSMVSMVRMSHNLSPAECRNREAENP